jgi:enamidase
MVLINLDAITSATSVAAQSIKLDGSIGMLKEGMTADMIAVQGNPITDFTAMRRVVLVVRDGRVVKN